MPWMASDNPAVSWFDIDIMDHEESDFPTIQLIYAVIIRGHDQRFGCKRPSFGVNRFCIFVAIDKHFYEDSISLISTSSFWNRLIPRVTLWSFF
ncbi:MAG: hypothetical protein WBZ36_15525 [Candidatus Nitrosopolaris sp.]